MKAKLDISQTSGRRLLLETDKDDSLVYADAERAKRGDLDPLLPFTYWRDGRVFRFAYYVGESYRLSRVLDGVLSPTLFGSIVVSFLHLIKACEESGLSRLRIMFDLENVFFDPSRGMLRFAYVPTRMFVSPFSEAALLARVCAGAKVPQEAQPFVSATWDFVSRTSMLTGVAFADFLAAWGFDVRERGASCARMSQGARVVADGRAGHGWDFVSEAEQRGDAALWNADGLRDAGGLVDVDVRIPSAAEAGEEMTLGRDGVIGLVRVSTGERCTLGLGEYVLGRSMSSAVPLSDAEGVSRRHARLVVGFDVCTIEDLGSTNGLRVDGKAVVPGVRASLSYGSRIVLGIEEFLVE